MATKKTKPQVHIGFDSNEIIYMSQLEDPDLDPDNIIYDLLTKKALKPSMFLRTRKKDLPPLLQNNFLGEIVTLPNGDEIYGNLLDVWNMLSLVKRGYVKGYFCPTVKYEIALDAQAMRFANKYLQEITVDTEDRTEFDGKRWYLAQKYAEVGAIDLKRDAVTRSERITPDHCLAAEYALCGLNFVTANTKHLVHIDVKAEDCLRSQRICNVNFNFGLRFVTKDGKVRSPRSFSTENFSANIKRMIKKEDYSYLDFKDANLDENDTYIAH